MPKDAYAVLTQVEEQVKEKTEVVLSSAQRSLLEQVSFALQAPAKPRIVRYGEEVAPKGRLRVINGNVIEKWEPVIQPYVPGATTPFIAVKEYIVTQHPLTIQDEACDCIGTLKCDEHGVHRECGRRVPARVANSFYYKHGLEPAPKNFGEHVKQIQINAMPDDEYNSYYPTIPGNDAAHVDTPLLNNLVPTRKNNATLKIERLKRQMWRGSTEMRSRSDNPNNQNLAVGINGLPIRPVYKGQSQQLRGGTEIRHGRREWREKTKGMILWDSNPESTLKDFDRIKREQKAQETKRLEEISRKRGVDKAIKSIVEDN